MGGMAVIAGIAMMAGMADMAGMAVMPGMAMMPGMATMARMAKIAGMAVMAVMAVMAEVLSSMSIQDYCKWTTLCQDTFGMCMQSSSAGVQDRFRSTSDLVRSDFLTGQPVASTGEIHI